MRPPEHITPEWLRKHGFCEARIADFEFYFGSQGVPFDAASVRLFDSEVKRGLLFDFAQALMQHLTSGAREQLYTWLHEHNRDYYEQFRHMNAHQLMYHIKWGMANTRKQRDRL